MKVLGFFCALFLICSSLVFSQNWFVGVSGNFYFDNESTKSYSLAYTFFPEIGYKLNKYSFGISPMFQYQTRKVSYSYGEERIGFGTGLFLSYDIITFFNKLSVLGRLDTNYMYFKMVDKSYYTDEYTDEYHEHRIGLSVTPIIEYKLTDYLTLYSSIIGPIFKMEDYIYESMGYYTHDFSIILPPNFNFSLTNITFGFYITF